MGWIVKACENIWFSHISGSLKICCVEMMMKILKSKKIAKLQFQNLKFETNIA